MEVILRNTIFKFEKVSQATIKRVLIREQSEFWEFKIWSSRFKKILWIPDKPI